MEEWKNGRMKEWKNERMGEGIRRIQEENGLGGLTDKPGLPMSLPQLPCFPCPHLSACCSHGTSLTHEEAAALAATYGAGKVYRTRWGEWRTRVRNRRCVFLIDNRCTIHSGPHYPVVCKGFPWTDPNHGGPYEYDRTICPEFANAPELVAIGKAVNGER